MASPKGPPRLPWTHSCLDEGTHRLPPEACHYLQHVLRLQEGASVELFDGLGKLAEGMLQAHETILVRNLRTVKETGPKLTVACAQPKGERADWLVEKLSELGAQRLVWLTCERSVCGAAGAKRTLRWQRLAAAAARQARRNYVLQLSPDTTLDQWIVESATIAHRWVADVCGSPLAAPASIKPAETAQSAEPAMVLAVGPEGGFTEAELQQLDAAGYTPAGLNRNILRVETAAVAGAALLLAPPPRGSSAQSLHVAS